MLDFDEELYSGVRMHSDEIDQAGGYDTKEIDLTKICDKCGMPGLKWGKTKRGWRLFDGDEIHRCDNHENADEAKKLFKD